MRENLMKAIIKLDVEYVTIELGNTAFISVTVIQEIAKIFAINLKDIDVKFQELKDNKYNYDKFCDLCDENKANENKLLSEVFEYVEIKTFAEIIIKKIAEALQIRINNAL